MAETVSTPAGSPEEAILAAAAVNGTEVGRVETPYAEARPAARKQRPARERRVAAERRSGGFMRSFVVPVLAGTLLVAIGFGLYWGLGFAGHTGGKAPILTADATPAKTIPPKPVSTAPNSVVMQELSGTTPPASQEALVSSDQTAGATPAQVAAPTPTATKVAAGDSGLANRKVRTVTVRPDGTIVSGDDSVAGGTALPVSRPNVPAVPGVSTAEAAEPAPPATMPGAPTPPTTMAVASTDASPMAAMAAPDANAPLPMARAMRPEGPTVADNTADAVGPAPASAVNAQVNPSPAPRGKPLDLIGSLVNAADSAPTQPAPAQPKTRLASLDAPAPASNAAAHVQLASQPSEAAAETSANVLEQRYGALFNGVRPAVMKADLNGRGVRYRVVVERSVLDLPDGIAQLTAALGRDEQVRVVDQVPTKLVVADRSLAMVPLTSHSAEPAALVVHASGLLELLSGLFESVWRDALPLRLGASGVAEQLPDGPDVTDLEVLSLLLAGLTDASVAKQLDLGLRTVQRRVKHLMELTGVTTRLQLGWHAYERGWVSRDVHD